MNPTTDYHGVISNVTERAGTTIRQYRPAFIEGADPSIVSFETVDELMATTFVARFRTEPDFYRFSLFGGRDGMRDGGTVSLMAEYDSGRRWFVVGYIEGQPIDLPTWEPVREGTVSND
jgi:hypothetical protein